MYLLYLDDSGSAANPKEQHLVLGGFCVFERQLHYLIQALDDLAARLDATNPGDVEFHASQAFTGKSPPWHGLSKDERRKVLRDVLGVLAASHETTCAFACAVHKPSYPNRDPMEFAFADLCSRFDKFLKRSYRAGEPQRGLIVLDESAHETSLQRMARDFRERGTPWGTDIMNIAEVPLFVNSRASRALQLADHVAYAVFRRYESGDSSYFDIIASRFDEHDGVIHGIAHKHTQLAQCRCLACVSRR